MRKRLNPQPQRILNRDGKFNIARRGMKATIWSDPYHFIFTMSWLRFVGLVACAYLGINLLFTSAYLLCGPDALQGVSHGDRWRNFLDTFFFSVQTFATIGYGHAMPVSIGANLLVTLEALFGLSSFALGTGLLFARFSRPTAKVVFSNVATLTEHDGRLALIIRIGNKRSNQIVEAQVNMSFSGDRMTKEGRVYREISDMLLYRSRSPIFVLSWTVIHFIDKSSPLFGMTRDSLRERKSEVIVSLTGIDDTFSQTVHSRYSYLAEEILWERRFKDILGRTPDGQVEINLSGIHDVEEANA